MKPQTKDIRRQKELDADARQDARNSISDETQLVIIEGRRGESKKEVARLQAKIANRNK